MTLTASDSQSALPAEGATLPRLFTPPLVVGPPGPCGCGCALDDDTSAGFAVVAWACDVLHYPPDPWQRWLLIHGLELLDDGRPRFRTLLVEVARQNGKTTLLVILALWWQFVCEVGLVLGTSTKLDYARESWHAAVKLAEAAPALAHFRARRWTRETNGEQESWSTTGSRYKIAASNEEGGRSLTVHRLILDELRHHYDYSAWGASVNAGNAVKKFQVWGISNAGSDRSIVLNDLHDQGEAFITWANDVGPEDVAARLDEAPGDYRTGMFSWSCTEDMDPLDPFALAIANPNLGNRIEVDTLIGQARIAMAAGGPALATFKTENMCIRVRSMNTAIDLGAWGRSVELGTLDAYRGRIAACLDVSPDGARADLVVAVVLDDGRIRVEAVQSWETLAECREKLPAWINRVRPYTFGWFPNSGAAVLTAELGQRKIGREGWPPRGVRVAEIKSEAAPVCMGFAALVRELRVLHSGQDALTTMMGNAEKRSRGINGEWIFDRREGAGHITGVYAAAGAVHLARTIPAPTDRAGFHVAR
jgi:phage terminase large subunit-like protein